MAARVLLTDGLSLNAARILEQRGVQVDVRPRLDVATLLSIISDYDALAVRSATLVDATLISQAKSLKVIGRAGIGIDNVDLDAATARGIVVMNTPLGNAVTTAEHAIALLLALARKIPQANRSTHTGAWEKGRFVGVEITGKTLGLIGCGNVGAIVAQRALGLRMKVLVYDPYLAHKRAHELEVEQVDLNELLSRSDFISLHVPLTDQTRNLIDQVTLAQCRKGVYIVNCARGGLIVEEDLKQALLSGQVSGAAIDVFPIEPARSNILFGMEEVICTPHLGASTLEAQENVAVQIAKQIADYLLDGIITNSLNAPGMSFEESTRLRPYFRLANQLGSFIGQIASACEVGSGLREVKIEYEGHAATLPHPPLTASILKGLLSPLLDRVNIVSAPLRARERGIIISEMHCQERDYHTLIRVIVITEENSYEIAGSLFGGSAPRIVEIEHMPIEATLTSDMLLVHNSDCSGMVGRLGQALGEAGVNIGTLQLGRTEPGGRAICLIALDQVIDNQIVQIIRTLEGVLSVQALHFTE